MKRLLLGALIFNTVQPYIYDLTILTLKDRISTGKKTFIGLSDYHDKRHESNISQREYLLKIAENIENDSVRFLVEDLSSRSSLGDFGCASYVLNSKQGMLARLAQDLENRDVSVLNLEYRYNRVISCGGLLTSRVSNPYHFQPACVIKVADLYKEVSGLCNVIAGFDDGYVINRWYKENMKKVTRALHMLHLDTAKNKSIAAYMSDMQSRHRHHNKHALLRQLLTFDSGLLDCAMLHETIKNKGSADEVIIAVAGGTHIENVVAALERSGFEKRYHARGSNNAYRPDDPATAVGYEKSYHRNKPEPIDITMLEKFLK